MYISSLNLGIMCAAVFVCLLCSPFVFNQVYARQSSLSWLWAAYCTAVVVSIPLVILLGILL